MHAPLSTPGSVRMNGRLRLVRLRGYFREDKKQGTSTLRHPAAQPAHNTG